MNLILFTGLIGSLILVLGAAWPEANPKMHPTASFKNWCFAVGGFIMLFYAYLSYLSGGSPFFIAYEFLIVLASILMMLNAPDNIDIPVITLAGFGLIVWSFYHFEDYTTVFFILGLSGVGLGYALEPRTVRRNAALTLGSGLIAWFSYLEASWVFFWLNLFFSLFSAYYLFKGLRAKK